MLSSSILIFFGIGLICFFIGFIIALLILKSWAKAKAKRQLDAYKNEFIAIASHYLLTPLSIIEGAISTILEHEMTFNAEQRRDMYEKIEEGANRLLRISEQMLLVVRIEEGELTINRSIYSLSTIVQDVINKLNNIAKLRGIIVRLVSDPNNKYEGKYDQKVLFQAIEAVIENAIKFSSDNSQIIVTIQENNDQQINIVQVKDQGIGMTAEQMQMAREKFYRGTPPYQFDYEGIGLGLHVADVVIKAHNGRLIIQSSGKDRGSIVQIVLPKQTF